MLWLSPPRMRENHSDVSLFETFDEGAHMPDAVFQQGGGRHHDVGAGQKVFHHVIGGMHARCRGERGRQPAVAQATPASTDGLCQSFSLIGPVTFGHNFDPLASGRGSILPSMTNAPHILVVDDHREIRDLVGRALTREGFRVSAAADGKAMRKVLADSRIDLILLDLMLPGEGGLALCRELRMRSNIPIIMVTAKGEEVDRVIGLELGADDYLPKPFGTRELVARINAVLRRTRADPANAVSNEQGSKRYAFDRWVLNTDTRELVRNDGVTVALSTGEFDLLLAMVQRPARVLTREILLDLARGRAATAFDRSVDTQVSRLRKKLEVDPAEPKIIQTVWGGGYRFAATVSEL
jgi:two-component system OmpR family response regulator